MIVPKGRTVCIGRRKFVEGDLLPPNLSSIKFVSSKAEREEIVVEDIITEKLEEIPGIKIDPAPRRRGRPPKE